MPTWGRAQKKKLLLVATGVAICPCALGAWQCPYTTHSIYYVKEEYIHHLINIRIKES